MLLQSHPAKLKVLPMQPAAGDDSDSAVDVPLWQRSNAPCFEAFWQVEQSHWSTASILRNTSMRICTACKYALIELAVQILHTSTACLLTCSYARTLSNRICYMRRADWWLGRGLKACHSFRFVLMILPCPFQTVLMQLETCVMWQGCSSNRHCWGMNVRRAPQTV